MPKIVDVASYDGFDRRVERLGLSSLLEEVEALVTGFPLLLAETREADGAAAVREMLDLRFKTMISSFIPGGSATPVGD
jgi:hypothetical protein